MPGPVGMDSSQLARPRERKGGDQLETIKGTARSVTWPDIPADWHDIAKMVWEGAKASGQADFYQQSDVAILYSICDDLHYYKSPWKTFDDGTEYSKRSGQMLQTIMAALASLLLTVGDRRRLRMELTAPPDDKPAASVAVMDDYRSGLSLVRNEDLPKTD